MSNTGTQISDMTDSAAVFPSGSFVPFIVTDPATGLLTTINYRFDAGRYLPSYAVLAASSGSNLLGFLQSSTGAQARTVQDKLRDTISVFDFMTAAQIAAVKANNYAVVTAAAITTACQNAITAAAGGFVHFPTGTYRISSTLSYNVDATFGFVAPGIKIVGDGPGKTIFDNRVANAPMIDIDAANHGIPYEASWGAVLREFSIINVSSPANSIGIRVINGYEVDIHHLYITGMTAYGIELKNGAFLDDGWNMVSITNSWIEGCLGWGIKADGASGRNEGSFTYLRQVFFQYGGTASGSTPPPSGGMIWKGQGLVMEDCGFANGTENVGLYIPGGAGVAQTVDIRNTTFENCKKRGLYVTGIHVFKGRNLQFYNADAFTATNQCEFDGSAFDILQVDIDGVSIRATAANSSLTAFKISGANAQLNNCRVRNVNWENFDFTGQTRFDGWQFDRVAQCCRLLDSGSAVSMLFGAETAAGNGNSTPYRLRGPNNITAGSGVASTSGEWTERQVASSLVLSSVGLAINTTFNVYLYDNDGAPVLEASTTAPVTNAATGYMVKTGDATKLWVGRVATTGTVGGEFLRVNTGWLNPTLITGDTMGAIGTTWRDTAASPDRIYYKNGAAFPGSISDGQYVELT